MTVSYSSTGAAALCLAHHGPPVLDLELTAAQSRALGANLDALVAAPHAQPPSDAERIRALEPIRALVTLARASLLARPQRLIRLRGLPVDRVDAAQTLPHPTPRADALLHAWACVQGRAPIVYGEAHPGQLFQHVFPLPHTLDKPHAHGAAPIRWHIDGGGHPHDLIPDRMGLLGIENATGEPTHFAATDAVLAALPAATARLLAQPLYRYHLPRAAGGVDKARYTPWLPLVVPRAGRASVSYMFPYVLPMPGTGAAEAVAALERAASEAATRVAIARGELLFWCNGPVMHARAALAHDDGVRWLKRVFALRVTRHNRDALGPGNVVCATPAVLERLMPRYRP